MTGEPRFFPPPPPSRGSDPELSTERFEIPTMPLVEPPTPVGTYDGDLLVGHAAPETLAPSEAPATSDEGDSIWRQFWRRRWTILGLAILSFTASLLVGLYRAGALDREHPSNQAAAAQPLSPPERTPPLPAPAASDLPASAATPAPVEGEFPGSAATPESSETPELPSGGKARIQHVVGRPVPSQAVPRHYTPNRI